MSKVKLSTEKTWVAFEQPMQSYRLIQHSEKQSNDTPKDTGGFISSQQSEKTAFNFG